MYSAEIMLLRLHEQGVSGKLADVRVGEHDVHLARRRDHHTRMLLSVRRRACAFVYKYKLIITFKFNTKNKTQKNITKFSFSTNIDLLLTHGHILLVNIKKEKESLNFCPSHSPRSSTLSTIRVF
jgi:hypothetical protein